MEITKQYTVLRSNLGKQPLFCEQGPDMCDSIQLNPDEHKRYILRNPVHEAIQNTPLFSQNTINTIRAEYSTSGANHAEGGWAKDINMHDPEATERYRKKIQKDDGYIHCITVLNEEIDHLIMQNNAIDMYQNYFTEMGSMPELEKRSVRTVNEYRDQSHRPVSSISWQPEGHRFAVTYVDLDLNRQPRGPIHANVWDMDNANEAELTITPPCPLLDLVFNPRDGNVLAGALSSGQVSAWDRRAGGQIQAICEPHVSHRDMTRRILFINSKSGQEFFSGSSDGTCKWWDLRSMKEPTDMMIMDVVQSSFDEQNMANSFGVSTLEYEATIPTRFMVGTENGYVLGGNRKGKTALEKIPAKFFAHSGPIWSLERNPSFLKNFLTVGDWTARVWSEECRDSAVLWSSPLRHRATAGAWSPTRASLMVLTNANGFISLWDLLRKQHEAVLTQKVSLEPLLTLKFHEGGSLLATGDQIGTVFMSELSQHLTQSDKNDKALLQAVLDRETKRERILEARLREIRLKQRQAEEGDDAGSLGDDPAAGDRDLADATADYWAQVKKEMAHIY